MKRRAQIKITTQGTASVPESVWSRSGDGMQEIIAMKAYDLYEQRGREDGHALDDWLRAEAQVKQQAP